MFGTSENKAAQTLLASYPGPSHSDDNAPGYEAKTLRDFLGSLSLAPGGDAGGVGAAEGGAPQPAQAAIAEEEELLSRVQPHGSQEEDPAPQEGATGQHRR